jgi:deoxyribonuclease I
VVGNRNSKVYHWNPGCPDFFKIAAKNKVSFKSKEEAAAAGYRAAKNCRQP